MKKLLLLAVSLLATSACSNSTKNKLGLTETMPDEYQVRRNKSLEVPPCYQPEKVKDNKSKNTNSNLSKEEHAFLNKIK